VNGSKNHHGEEKDEKSNRGNHDHSDVGFQRCLGGGDKLTPSAPLISGGSGTATAPTGTPYTVAGAFAFSPAGLGGGNSFKSIFGDVGQFTFAANSAGTLSAFDYSAPGSAFPGPSIFHSNQQWIIGNSSVPTGDSRLYGNIVSFAFDPSGTVTGTLKTDGYIHWYYGYDNYNGSPHGEASLASLGLSDTLNFSGTWTGGPAGFTLTSGTVSASTVPIPGALVLFGSGLLGLVGIGRKRLHI
jgi:hypothetical protein